jgi:hypothetical protein
MGRSGSPSREAVEVDPDWVDERRNGFPPSHRLLIAIIRRAVWDYVLYQDVKKKDDPVLHEIGVEAAEWLFWDGREETDGDGRYTFRHICDLLELDPVRIRQAAAVMTRDDIARLNNNIKDE